MGFFHRFKNFTFPKPRTLINVFCYSLPLLLIPLLVSSNKESRCAYVIILMAAYWLLEPVPVSATALLPVVLFPLTGILDSSDVCLNYMKEPLMMFIGGLIVAIAVEHCMLHERIALKILLLTGTDIKWLLLGFMSTTMFLSMWISNTATTAMMVPIAEAITEEMCREAEGADDVEMERVKEKPEDGETITKIEVNRNTTTRAGSSNVKVALLLSICYSANIGGTGTLTGTGPNLVFKGLMEELHPGSEEITFATWMMYNIPGMIFCVFVGWMYLYIVYVRCSKEKYQSKGNEHIRKIISCRYRKLGTISIHESSVIVLFLILVFLWVFRDPKFITGWADALGTETRIGDSVPALAVAVLLFLLPSDPRKFAQGPPLLDWKIAQRKLPWGVIILGGGGYAVASAAQKSGLSKLVGQQLSSLVVLPPGAIVAIICFMTAMITEVTTNTTTANILLPVFSEMAIAVGMNPLYLMLPVTVTCSYAFMLPAATPPNAIVYESANMKAIQMMKPGLVMNIACCAVQLFMINTLGSFMFSVTEFPQWARHEQFLHATSNVSSDFFETSNSTVDILTSL